MTKATSEKLAEVARTAATGAVGGSPASVLVAVAVSLRALVSEVQDLEAAAPPAQDAAPNFKDDLRVHGELLRTRVESAAVEFRQTLADALRAAAKNLDRGTDGS